MAHAGGQGTAADGQDGAADAASPARRPMRDGPGRVVASRGSSPIRAIPVVHRLGPSIVIGPCSPWLTARRDWSRSSSRSWNSRGATSRSPSIVIQRPATSRSTGARPMASATANVESHRPVPVEVDRVAEHRTAPSRLLQVDDRQPRETRDEAPDVLTIGADRPDAFVPLEPGGLGRRDDPVDGDPPIIGQGEEPLDELRVHGLGLPAPPRALERPGQRARDRDEGPGRHLGSPIERPVAEQGVRLVTRRVLVHARRGEAAESERRPERLAARQRGDRAVEDQRDRQFRVLERRASPIRSRPRISRDHHSRFTRGSSPSSMGEKFTTRARGVCPPSRTRSRRYRLVVGCPPSTARL